MRVDKMIAKGETLWFSNKFFQLILYYKKMYGYLLGEFLSGYWGSNS